jgi:hypothetical protein
MLGTYGQQEKANCRPQVTSSERKEKVHGSLDLALVAKTKAARPACSPAPDHYEVLSGSIYMPGSLDSPTKSR